MVSKTIGAIGSKMLARKELTKGTKLRVVNAMIIPTLTYGSVRLTTGQLEV